MNVFQERGHILRKNKEVNDNTGDEISEIQKSTTDEGAERR